MPTVPGSEGLIKDSEDAVKVRLSFGGATLRCRCPCCCCCCCCCCWSRRKHEALTWPLFRAEAIPVPPLLVNLCMFNHPNADRRWPIRLVSQS